MSQFPHPSMEIIIISIPWGHCENLTTIESDWNSVQQMVIAIYKCLLLLLSCVGMMHSLPSITETNSIKVPNRDFLKFQG